VLEPASEAVVAAIEAHEGSSSLALEGVICC
jgi:hypothetical protein